MTQDEEAIARTCYGEARGEGDEGMQAVANTIVNRVSAQRWWGLSPYEVCHKPYQFSCWNKNDPNLPKILAVTIADPQFKDACDIATSAISGTLDDITSGAVSYYAQGTPTPDWAVGKAPCAIIGKHLFFRDIM